MTPSSPPRPASDLAPDVPIIDQGMSTATVVEAAAALGVEPARIAKTLSLRVGDQVALVVARGDARLSNGKAKAALGGKPRMLGAEEVEAITGDRKSTRLNYSH